MSDITVMCSISPNHKDVHTSFGSTYVQVMIESMRRGVCKCMCVKVCVSVCLCVCVCAGGWWIVLYMPVKYYCSVILH